MVLVKLQGGLGNQMFQFAAGTEFLNQGKKIFLDHHFLEANQTDTEHFTARKYELGLFKNITAPKASDWQINLFTGRSFVSRALRRILGKSVAYVQQRENEYIPLFAYTEISNLYLDGYFQSEKYFNNSREFILDSFQFPELDKANELVKEMIINSENAVSIHVRRGDYVRSTTASETHGVLPVSYYQKALTMLKAKHQKLTLFVFSDDMNWVRKNLDMQGFGHYFIEQNKAADSWKDMALMTFCRHHIIANSSFSWWGAWLSPINGDTFAPRNWFNPRKVKFDINDFIPAAWTLADYD